MYILINKKNKYKLLDKEELINLDGFRFGKKIHRINGVLVNNLVIYNNKFVNTIIREKVNRKYNKLILSLTELLVSDDDSGDSLIEALNRIEKFRQIIKNKYRKNLSKNELESMSKKLKLLKKEADNKLLELSNYKTNNVSKGTRGK